MDPIKAAAILVAGIAAGTINTVVGSGTLITFPVLLGLGYAPVMANVSNCVGLVAGSLSGAYGYRREFRGQGARALRLSLPSLLGGLTGAILLLGLPPAAFKAIVPACIGLALLLVVAQPRLAGHLQQRRGQGGSSEKTGLALLAFYLIGVYGGYFGAAQGVLLIAALELTLGDDLQRLNALKNVLAMLNNLVAGVFFVCLGQVDWQVALLVAAGSTVGGQIGARVGRRLPPAVLRLVIVLVGLAAMLKLLVSP